MPRVLFIIPRKPYPIDDGWKIRTFHLIKGWKNFGVTIDLLSFIHEFEKGEPINGLNKLCNNIYFVNRVKSYAKKDLIRGMISPVPFTILNYYSEKMHQFATELNNRTPYDFIQVEGVMMAQYAENGHNSLRIFDMHNVESDLLMRYAQNERNLAKKTYAYLTAVKLKRYEINACKKFDRVLVCSNEDKAILRKYGIQTSIHILPNGVDCDYFSSVESQPTINDIVFVGSMDYHANISGVTYFVKSILPLIWKKRPDIRFVIVGKNPPKSLQELSSDKIIVTGLVPDVRPYVTRSRVVVVPLLVGGGTRLKILEAMALGKSIVSSSQGAEGINVVNGEHIILSDNPDKFASEVLSLFDNPLKCDYLGRNARKFVLKHYSWSAINDSFFNNFPNSKNQ
jgi:polysaccharide biosynthesis protein PslH